MKTILLLAAVLLVSISANAQIIMQTNFVGTDCNGQQHNLFAELDQGKVIVLCWVMPCGACTGPAKTSYNIVKSYQSQYPGKVLFYLADDYGNTNCTSLNSWANSQNMPASESSIRFSSQSLDMKHFGTVGMPKVVIIGGADHKIYYNANNQVNSDQMLVAINAAIDQTTGVTAIDDVPKTQLTVHPIPADQEVSLSFTLNTASDVNVDIVNGSGEVVKSYGRESLDVGPQALTLNTMALQTGTYFVRLHTREGVYVSKCVIVR